MTHLLRDAHYGLRVMARRPGLTVLAILALALGIGAVTAQFSIINGVMWRGLPFRDPDSLVTIRRWNIEHQPWDTNIPIHDFNDLVARQKSFEGIAGWFGGTVNLAVDGNPIRLQGPRISHNFLDLVGVQPLVGRGFTAGEDRPDMPPVAILSYAVWQRHFNGDPKVVGRSVRINGKPGTIVGVMPAGFSFPIREEVWIPLQSSYSWAELKRGQGMQLNAFGRLRAGVTRAAAEAEFTGLVVQLAEAYPDSNKRHRLAEVMPFVKPFTEEMNGVLYVMLAAGVFILLIACANVANLLLVSFSSRIKELAVRSSLGASRARLMLQILTESVLLSIVGALGGLGIAVLGLRLLTGYGDTIQLPFWINFSLDRRALLVVVATTVLAGLISGLIPALRASRANMNDILKDDSRTGTSLHMGWLSRILVMFQIAISCVLLVLSGLMVRSIQKIQQTDYGFDTSSVLTARMGLFDGDYPTSEDRRAFYTRLRRNLEQRPEIASVTLYGRYRWQTMGGWAWLARDGRTYAKLEDHMFANYEQVEPGYFRTLGVKILGGREFTETDLENGAAYAVVNKKLADALFPGEDPIGQRFQRQPFPGERGRDGQPPVLPWVTIIGVVPPMQSEGAGNTIEPTSGRAYYLLPDPKAMPSFMTVAVRARAPDPKSALRVVQEEVVKLDPNLPLYAIGTPAEIIAEDTAQKRLVANIFKVFGVVAVFLAAVGIYGVVSFSVTQRQQEFGIRASLGATSRMLLMMILRSSALQLAIGLVVGLPLAWLLSYFMRTILYGVGALDVTTYAIVAGALGTVVIIACLVPALRAARTHPAQALRHT